MRKNKIARIIGLIIVLFISAMAFASCSNSGFNERQAEMYDLLYNPIVEYIEAQESAHEREGTYKSLYDLVQQGYLPGHFPRTNPTSDIYFELSESNLTQDTFTIQARPLGSHFESFGVKPLWADQTGVIRLETIDGREYVPDE